MSSFDGIRAWVYMNEHNVDIWLPRDAPRPDKVQRVYDAPYFVQYDRWLLPCVDIQDEAFALRQGTGEEAWNLGLTSAVRYRNDSGEEETRYLGLLDMKPSASDANFELVRSRLEEVIVPQYGGGLVVNSGNSFHFIGLEPMSKEKLTRFYGACLLLTIPKSISPTGETIYVPDVRYIGHRLSSHDGVGTLRMTASEEKSVTPYVAGVVGLRT